MKVGRAALDEDAIRMIEEHNPDIEFDWTRILKGQGDGAPERERRPQSPPPQRERRQQPRPFDTPSHHQQSADRRAHDQLNDRIDSEPAVADRATDDEAPMAMDAEERIATSVDWMPESAELAPEGEGSIADAGPMSAAEAKLGSEGLGRLRGRYAEMLARISERISDPERQGELKGLAERLNPDAWVTAEDVAAGLDSYEATFESLRGAVGHRRRRRRRRPQQGAE